MRISLALLFAVVLQLPAENGYAQRTHVAISMNNEVVSKRWHNLFFTFYSPAIFSFAYDAFF